MGNIGSVLTALIQGSAQGFVEAEQEDKLKQENEKLAVKQRRFDMAKLIFNDDSATPEAKRLALEVIGGKSGKATANFDQFVALGTMEVPQAGGEDLGSALPRGRPVALQGPGDVLNDEGNINPDAQASITEGGGDVGAQLEEGLAQQPPSDFAELEQPPTGPTQEALDRRVISGEGTKEVGIFKTEIEQIEETFRATEKVRDLNTQARLRDASVYLQGLPPEIPLADKQSFFSMVRQGGDVIAVAQALGFPMTVAQKKEFKEQAKNSFRNEATILHQSNPTISKADFRDRFADTLGQEETDAIHTALNQDEATRLRNVEEQEARIAKLKADAAEANRLAKEGKPLSDTQVTVIQEKIEADLKEYATIAATINDQPEGDRVLMIGEKNVLPFRQELMDTLGALATTIRANQDRLNVPRTQFQDELPDFEAQGSQGESQRQAIEAAVNRMDINQLGAAFIEAGEFLRKPGLSAQEKAQARMIQRTIQLTMQRKQEGLAQ